MCNVDTQWFIDTMAHQQPCEPFITAGIRDCRMALPFDDCFLCIVGGLVWDTRALLFALLGLAMLADSPSVRNLWLLP